MAGLLLLIADFCRRVPLGMIPLGQHGKNAVGGEAGDKSVLKGNFCRKRLVSLICPPQCALTGLCHRAAVMGDHCPNG